MIVVDSDGCGPLVGCDVPAGMLRGMLLFTRRGCRHPWSVGASCLMQLCPVLDAAVCTSEI
jgi:hypothetical protein